MALPNRKQLCELILLHKARLDRVRRIGDPLKIELAENGLNSLLEELSQLSHVTSKEGK